MEGKLDLFVEVEELSIYWGENKNSLTVCPKNKNKEVIIFSQENWVNRRVFLRESIGLVLNTYLLSKTSEKKIEEAFHMEFDKLKEPKKTYSEEDLRFFIHMAYIAGVKKSHGDIKVDNVDLIVNHLIDIFPDFKDDKNTPFYEVVGEFAEQELCNSYNQINPIEE